MMTNVEKVNDFLNRAGVWFFLTTDGDQPKGRPFGFHLLKDGTLYFGTGTLKQVYRPMQANPNVEILAVCGDEFLRLDGKAVFEETDAIADAVLANAPALQKLYNDEIGYKLGIFHLTGGRAEIRTTMGQKEAFEL